LFVGLLGNSCGAHYEFGIALAAGKPCIIIDAYEISNSFLASGIDVLESDDLIRISCTRLKEAEELIRTSSEIQEFIERHLGRGTLP
jgi:cysteine sulfinate desulfinase/cysteine desulfurase-like protein